MSVLDEVIVERDLAQEKVKDLECQLFAIQETVKDFYRVRREPFAETSVGEDLCLTRLFRICGLDPVDPLGEDKNKLDE